MTPGQTRVLVLLLILVAVEVFLHPTLVRTIKSTVAVHAAPQGS